MSQGLLAWFCKCDYVLLEQNPMSVDMVVANNLHHGSHQQNDLREYPNSWLF